VSQRTWRPQCLEQKQISHRDDADQLVPLQDREVTNAQIQHAGHDIVGVLVGIGYEWAETHESGNPVSPRVGTLRSRSCQVAFRQDADQAAALHNR
jgi:hypothetical protein